MLSFNEKITQTVNRMHCKDVWKIGKHDALGEKRYKSYFYRNTFMQQISSCTLPWKLKTYTFLMIIVDDIIS